MDGQDNLKTAVLFAVLDLLVKNFDCKSGPHENNKERGGEEILSVKGGLERYKVLTDIMKELSFNLFFERWTRLAAI